MSDLFCFVSCFECVYRCSKGCQPYAGAICMNHILTRAFSLRAYNMHMQLSKAVSSCKQHIVPSRCGPAVRQLSSCSPIKSAATEVVQTTAAAAAQQGPLEQARERREFKPRTSIRKLLVRMQLNLQQLECCGSMVQCSCGAASYHSKPISV